LAPVGGAANAPIERPIERPTERPIERRPPDIVDLHAIDPSIQVDLMYAGSVNFMGRPVDGYRANVCWLTKPAALGLLAAQLRLQARAQAPSHTWGTAPLSLFVRDCYRPQRAVRQFVAWAADASDTRMKAEFYPDLAKPRLIADGYIAPVSGHSRASTVDLTIARQDATGAWVELPMGTRLDYFGERSHTDFAGIDDEAKASRQLLKEVLSPEFQNFPKEWWHYTLQAEPYPSTLFDFEITEPSPRAAIGGGGHPKPPAN
jgi:D-alanyl-D-alanine dipeptidase